jgi:hypothetical protein
MKASSESGLWAMLISWMAAEAVVMGMRFLGRVVRWIGCRSIAVMASAKGVYRCSV